MWPSPWSTACSTARDGCGSPRTPITSSDRSPWSTPAKGSGQLRWFLLVPEVRGSGLGRRLLEAALAYGRERGFSRIFLWTFADLEGARRLYERAGFRITETKTGLIWGAERTELRMEMAFGG